MLLAKVYLNAQVYTGTDHFADVITALGPVLAPSVYQLDPVYQHLFLADNNTSPELIFVVPVRREAHAVVRRHHVPDARRDGRIDEPRDRRRRWRLGRIASATGGLPALSFHTWTGSPGGLLLYDQSDPVDDHLTDFAKGYLTSKYRNVKSDGTPGQIPGFSDVDYPMFRLGDAYLMYAEAVLRGGGGTRAQALLYVNALRERAYGNASGDITDAQLTLDFIKDERSRELLWEGHRRTDLIRFNDAFTDNATWQWKGNVLAGRPTESFRNLYPLPASEVIANPNLTQNTGY